MVGTGKGHFRNRVKLAASYSFKKPFLPLFPQEAAIEITNHCNLSCRMCPHNKMTRTKGIMDYGLFCRIIDELKESTEFIYLYGTGESLLVKNFFDYAAYAVKSGMTTCLSTNATLINESVAERLIDSGIDFVVLAVDGATGKTYNKIRIGADFDSTIKRCKTLLQAKLKKKAKTDITIQCILMEENSSESTRLESNFSGEENRSAINQFRIKPLYESYAQGVDSVVHTCPCYFLWDFISITWDGKVQLCCMDYDASHVIGDAIKQSIKDIWNGTEIQKLRRLHLDLQHDSIPLCRKCTLPEKKYFSRLTVLGSMFINSHTLRKITPFFEKHYVLKGKGR